MLSRRRSRLWTLVGALVLSAACGSEDPESDACTGRCQECTEGANELFEQRIEPVLTDDHPSSCNRCHLSGVDLNLFVRDTPCETMACLIEKDLVDLDDPKSSKVLGWIERAAPASDLITDEVVQAEYDAFYEWISYVADCGACKGAKCGSEDSGGFCDLDVEPSEAYDGATDPGGCDDKALEQVFLETVYVTRGRCYPCHFKSNENPPVGAIQWLVEEENCEASSLETMRNVIANGFVDVDDPEKSLLLLKPLAESDGGLPHGGDAKFHKEGDPAYPNFLYWLERYAACQNEPP